MNPNQPNPNEQPQHDTNRFPPIPENNPIPVTPEHTASPVQLPSPEANPAPQFQQPVPPPVEKKSSVKKWIITAATAIVVFIVGGVVQYVASQVGSNIVKSGAGTTSNKEYIEKAVATAKSSTTLPMKVDSVTTLEDITAKENAVSYSYLLTDVDPADLDSTKLRTSILSSVCKNADTKAILDRGISMDYNYKVQNYTETFNISITKNDCI